MNGLNKFASPK